MKTAFSKLNSKSLFVLCGPDSQRLLQGIITNDMANLNKQSAIYTLFLTPKGKILTDAVLIKPKCFQQGIKVDVKDEFWLQVDSQAKEGLKNHLKKYMWKKQVELIDTENEEGTPQSIYAAYSLADQMAKNQEIGKLLNLSQQPKLSDEECYSNLLFRDPRGPSFGIKIINSFESIEFPQQYFSQESQQQYIEYETMQGMVPYELYRDKLPFQFNFDLMNAIAFKKGCYLGQQIISRAYYTGIIRRRTFPFLIKNQKEEPILNAKIRTKNGKMIGKVVSHRNNTGFGLVEYLDLIKEKWPLEIVEPFEGTIFSPFHGKVKTYFEEMKKKQDILSEIDL